jgi:cytochrome c biogenesis protein CcdA
MDIVTELSRTILQYESIPFAAGLIAAFTPCTLAIIPIFLYRFGLWEGSQNSWRESWQDIVLLLIGFLLSFGLTGIAFGNLFSSDYVNVTRLLLGTLLVLMGALQLLGRLNLQFATRSTNPLMLGAILPWVVSFSPCVLPFLSALLLSSTSGELGLSTMFKFLQFGLGLLTPAIVIALLGRVAVNALRRSTNVLGYVERFSPALLILAGFYISSQLVQITNRDMLVACLGLLLLVGAISYIVFRKPSRRTALNYKAFFALLAVAFSLCVLSALVSAPLSERLSGEELLHACLPGGHQNSPIAFPIAVMFNGFALLLAWWVSLADVPGKRVKLSF